MLSVSAASLWLSSVGQGDPEVLEWVSKGLLRPSRGMSEGLGESKRGSVGL